MNMREDQGGDTEAGHFGTVLVAVLLAEAGSRTGAIARSTIKTIEGGREAELQTRAEAEAAISRAL
jgi:energy-converting hydrogenase Eha subunit B